MKNHLGLHRTKNIGSQLASFDKVGIEFVLIQFLITLQKETKAPL
jgi:hypothetical protein